MLLKSDGFLCVFDIKKKSGRLCEALEHTSNIQNHVGMKFINVNIQKWHFPVKTAFIQLLKIPLFA